MHKKATIISIGNELLSGKTVDTNAAYIEAQLRTAGIPVVGVYCVGDEEPAIRRRLAQAGEESDILILTGGLGPTDDDLTRQAIAGFLGVELVLRDDLVAALREFFERRGVEMPARNTIQACIPRGATAIENQKGTAPGIRAKFGGKILFAMPGVPGEMRHMFDTFILPELRRLVVGQAIVVKRLRCFGAGESKIAEMIGDAMERGRNPLVNCTVHEGVVTLEIVATASETDEAEAMAARVEQSLRAAVGHLVYGTDAQTLAEVVGERLAELGRTVAVAESCTGGLLASLITDVAGSSRYFTCGWVTYSNTAKQRELEVSSDMIDRYGAVSEQVAAAMAQGARRRSGADYAIGITGIAGPGGGSDAKPVGLVYIALDSRNGTEVWRYFGNEVKPVGSVHVAWDRHDGATGLRHVFSWDRSSIRLRAAQTALNLLRLKLVD
ncbi:MAG TPA: competence/damage-inducible protein A [Sedimentisphaerales bacterium]|nr:competence/damage-inducible protein A [Sedimentisphaerales bacterium]HQI28805.1 competence/damage-inducible protein A [Sedimentisphaerales bacterium]